MNKALTPALALGLLAGSMIAPVTAFGVSSPDSVVVPAGHKAHEGKRCHHKGKVKVVGNRYHKVKLKCEKVRRGDRHVLVWKYHGRA